MSGKLAIGYISGGAWKDNFGRSMFRFARHDAHERNILHDDLCFGNGHYLDLNRNRSVLRFLKTDAEWYLSLDTDIGFHPTVPYRLLDQCEAEGYKILSAMYIGRLEGVGPDGYKMIQLCPMLFSKDEKGVFQTCSNLDSTVEIDGMGMGCVLIHRSVFEGMPDEGHPRRWFRCGDRFVEDEGLQFIGEDLDFSVRAQAAGFKLYGDPRIQVSHEKSEMLTAANLIRENLIMALQNIKGEPVHG